MTQSAERNFEKSLPASEESERVILAMVLIDNATMPEIAEALTPADFYSPNNRRIFGAMLAIHNAGKSIDAVKVGEYLKRENSLDQIGGVVAIANLSLGVPFVSNLADHIEIVRQKSQVRELIRTCNAIVSEAMIAENPPEVTLESAQSRVNDVCLKAIAQNDSDGFVPLSQVITADVLPGLESLHKGTSRKISTGFDLIDRAIGGGLSTSDVMLLAGLPSSGKSALALQMAYNVAKKGVPAAFLAGEMTNKENVFRLLSQISEIENLNTLMHITAGEHKFLTDWAEAIRNVPLYLDHRTSDVHTLATRLRSIVRQHGIKLLVIDYIQLLKVEKVDKRKRFERITEASQEVKRLANELDIAVISVAQFNREGAKSGKPSMHDLESSGQLEKDASLILILDRDASHSSEVEVRIVKGRNSGISKFTGRFYGRTVRFEFDDPRLGD